MSEQPRKRLRWPWFVLAGVVIFFSASVVWMMVFIQRVKRIKESTIEMNNPSQSNAAPAKQ